MSTRRLALCACLALASAAAAPLTAAEPTTIVIQRPPAGASSITPLPAEPPFVGQRAAVDVALLLDTSGSMSGLISQAKTQLWTIVQQFARAKHAGQTPTLRVALFEYGNNGLPAGEGYIRQVVPLTDDLDELSAALFALTTNGGSEYCGQVIEEAVTTLDWSDAPNAYQAIFIAGNEPFTQGSVDYRDACKQAIQAGIVVNTIHCGAYEAGKQGNWHDGAQLAEGRYLNIDQDRTLAHIDAPQDKIIIQLNEELNKTYIWIGSADERQRRSSNQIAQDNNAIAEAPAVAVSRISAKAGAAYRNVGRDLVDTAAEDFEAVEALPTESLPASLAALSAEELKAHIDEKAQRRSELQKQIAELTAERDQYIAARRAEAQQQQAGDATLGDAMVQAVREQLTARGFKIE